MKQPLSETLASRTFIGLLLAQFTATFNDQAIHMVAVFYAADMLVRFAQVPHIDDKAVVSIVTACFITPFLLFSSFAGPLGDRFSKRSVIVFWKVAEVGMMALALLGLSLPHLVGVDSPHLQTAATWSAILVIATVFLMGLHSTFFVPAKLGAMPEILHPSILSRGNGILEGTSFTAQILGTSAGGILYSLLKGEVIDGKYQPGQEWQIGALLLGLAFLGTITAVLMERIPAAAPDKKLSWNWWKPLQANLGILWRSKPLMLSVTGIAFCVFMTLFLRQTLLFQGELVKELRVERAAIAKAEGRPPEQHVNRMDRLLASVLPPKLAKAAEEPELRVALLFALVGLGVGLGSIVAGYLSGHRVELGLVPLGALSIVIFTFLPAARSHSPRTFITSLFGIGFGAGFYLVPLYTLLQHRAPKAAKGNVVAASNFLNVVGGIVSVGLFYALSFALDKFLGANIEDKVKIPQLLFLATTVLTVAATMVLVRRLPDFFVRTAIWLRAWGHNTLRTVGIEHMPLDGPVILVTNCDSFDAALQLVAAVDRYPRVILLENGGVPESGLMSWMARQGGLVTVPKSGPNARWDAARMVGLEALQRGDMVAVNVTSESQADNLERLFSAWKSCAAATLVPVYCDLTGRGPHSPRPHVPRVYFGNALPTSATLADARTAIAQMAANPPADVGH